ncbi:MAG: IPT/TIG domain-containing protein [Candidatus Vogelbacteria bacterium]|nr:IPT/TIG domain-containing protein [Candidatus Vogelbacteria bacterium]
MLCRSGIILGLIILISTSSVSAAVDLTSEVSRLQALVASLQAKLNQLLNQVIERATLGGAASPLPQTVPVSPVNTPSLPALGVSGMNFPPEPKRSTTTFIENLSPSSGPVGTVVTIKGRGFTTQSPNTIYASYQVIKGVKSRDGTTLTFIVSAFDNDFAGPKVFKNRPAGRTVSLPLIVTVQNDTGISNDMMFTVTYPAPIYEPQI